MTTELFTKWLQTEAEKLFQRGITPERFISRVKPLIEELSKDTKEKKSERMASPGISDKSLPRDCVSCVQKKNSRNNVCLCLFRAN
jgi:hypothetical protein